MKKTKTIISTCIGLLLTACGSNNPMNSGELPVINIEAALQSPQEMSVSDFGDKITYVPLETLDESLVKLGSSSKMIVTNEYILVGELSAPLLCFDRATGKFLRKIGSVGQGPGEYSGSTDMEVDAEAKRVYFRASPTQYHCYDFEGKFLNTITLPEDNFMMGGHHFANNQAYAYCNLTNAATTCRAYAYQLPEGICTDSLVLSERVAKKQKAVMPVSGTEAFGGRLFMWEYEDGTWSAGNRLNSTYQSMDGKLYHKDLFCDTLFQMKGLHREAPIAAFHLGNYGGYGRYETTGGMEGKYVLPRVLFNGEHIYFTLFTGLYDIQGLIRKIKGEGIRPSIGIYNLRTGEVKVQKEKMYLQHPDEGMPKACIYTLSTDGHWVAVYQAEKLVEARENIPAENQPEWMKNLEEDDNPVILMIK